MYRKTMFIVILFCTFTSAGFCAEAVKSRFVSVSLFKNGLGFVTSEAELTGKTDRIILEQLPVPVHGTFWVYPIGKGVSIGEVRAFENEIVECLPAINMAEVLEANVGSTVVLQLSDGKTITGKILSVPSSRIQPVPAPQLRSSYYPAPAETASLMVLQTDEGVVFMNKNSVQQVSILSPGNSRPLKPDFKTGMERRKPGAAMEISATGKGKIGFQYLTKGITWAPSCSVDISDPKKARILTKAEIINEIGDLENISVNFISGFPNFLFSEVISPIARQGDLAAFLNSLANPAGRPRSDVMTQRAMFNIPAESESFSGYVTRPAGQSMEELFLYERKNVTLKKGERGYYPLYEMEVPYEHIYEWKIEDTLDEQERYQRNEQTRMTEEVWHSLRLTNTGKIPWTTAPAMTVQSGQILGQDIIYYTSPGGTSNLRITQAVDIKAEQGEYEVNRQRNAANFYGCSYDLVDIKGVLNATNYKTSEVKLTITKMLSGEVVSAGPDAKIEKIARGLKRVNPNCRLTWEIPVKAAEKIQIEYQYKVYVRN